MTSLVYLGAVGRSGTTLIERVAATSPSYIALGEVVHLWERGLRHNEPCSCGQPFRSCNTWNAIAATAFGGWDALDLDAVQAAQRACDRNRYIPFLLLPRLAPRRFRNALDEFTATLQRLYSAIQTHHGDHVTLIDASKHPSYLFVLRHVSGSRPTLLHIVRDPRGVANSWNKVVIRPEAGDEMERLGPMQAAARWTSHNLLFQLAGVIGVRRRPLKYERFTEHPALLGETLAALNPHGSPQPPVIHDHTAVLGDDHTVSGNPMRFDNGPLTIRPDDGWRTSMPGRTRRLVGALTWPLRICYR